MASGRAIGTRAAAAGVGHTLATRVTRSGVGIHSGEAIELTLAPARAGQGLVFSGPARAGGVAPTLAAHARNVASTDRATTLATPGQPAFTIATVEHLLAALYALGVDDATIEVRGAEVPVFDGSAATFVEMIETAGIAPQAAPRVCARIRRRVEVHDGNRRIWIEPADGFGLDYTIDFAHPAIGRQRLQLADLSPDAFASELAPARTFGFLSDFDALRDNGLARGASLENTLVLDATGLMSPGGLRFTDEYVRHKALDLIGDLALFGLPLCGHVGVERGGHALHQRLVQALLAAPDAWALEPAGAVQLS